MNKPILIAHNGKGFDVWLILQENGIIPSKLIKTRIIEMRFKKIHILLKGIKNFSDKSL